MEQRESAVEGMVTRCRCCGAMFPSEPVLTYRNMPDRAQDFPFERDADQGIDLDILECPYCGLIQIAGEPVAYYRDVLRAVGLSEDMKAFRRRYFHDFLVQYGLMAKPVIEVGAGCGEYMELMAEAGGNVCGLEHRPASAAAGRDKGLRMYEGFLETAESVLPGGPYAGFYSMSFLEHLPDPGSYLRAIANNLEPGGVGLIEVPNGDYILREHIFSEFMLDHLSYFTEETFRLILQRNGFEMVSCAAVWREYILSAVVRKRERNTQWAAFARHQERLVEEIRRFAAGTNRMAVWGAGHQALALLSLADLGGRAAYVVDSAPFKQGRYTPATHIPIVSPDELSRRPVDALLIIAGSYNEEIQRQAGRIRPGLRMAVVDGSGVKEVSGV